MKLTLIIAVIMIMSSMFLSALIRKNHPKTEKELDEDAVKAASNALNGILGNWKNKTAIITDYNLKGKDIISFINNAEKYLAHHGDVSQGAFKPTKQAILYFNKIMAPADVPGQQYVDLPAQAIAPEQPTVPGQATAPVLEQPTVENAAKLVTALKYYQEKANKYIPAKDLAKFIEEEKLDSTLKINSLKDLDICTEKSKCS
jgi:hypothetical protein